jgi:hypothetical protein
VQPELESLERVVLAALRTATIEAVGDAHSRVVALERLLRNRGATLAVQNRVAYLRLRIERELGLWLRRNVLGGSHRRRLPVGVSKAFAFRCRRLSAIPEPEFEAIVAAHSDSVEVTMGFVLRQYYGAPRRRGVVVDVRECNITVGQLIAALPRLQPAFKNVSSQVAVLRAIVEKDTGQSPRPRGRRAR